MAVIYEIVNNKNNKVYIGQAKDLKSRIRSHKYSAKNKNTPLYSAISKYGWDYFTINIIEECDKTLLNDREVYWISQKKSIYPNGYNLLIGGNQSDHNEYTKIKISKKRIGIKFSQKHKDNLRLSHLGYVMPDEQKRKISQSSKGKVYSEETKKKLTFSQPHRKSIGRFDKNKNLLEIYDSIKSASKILGCTASHVSECCNGKRKMKKILGDDFLKHLT
jgi:group I intron endonuclease